MVNPVVSILLPFKDHDHVVGQVCRNLAELFRDRGLAFEIVAVDEGSGDNSHAMLALLRHDIPELRIEVGRGYTSGCAFAKAQTLVLVDVDAAGLGVCPSVFASIERVSHGEIEMYLVDEELLVVRTKVVIDLIATTSSWRALSERDLYNRGRERGLVARSYCPNPQSSGTFSRILGAISSARSKRSRAFS